MPRPIVSPIIRPITVLLALAIPISPAACKSSGSAPELSAEDKAEIARLVADTKKRALERDEERRKGIVAAGTTLVSRPDLGRCPVVIGWPWKPEALNAAIRAMDVRLGRMLFVEPQQSVNDELGPLYRHTLERAHNVTQYAMDLPEAKAQLAELETPKWWDFDLTLVLDERGDAKQMDIGNTKGFVRGRAYLWSFAERSVQCMAEIDAENADKIEITAIMRDQKIFGVKLGREKLGDDFASAARLQLDDIALRQAVSELVRAGPPAQHPQ